MADKSDKDKSKQYSHEELMQLAVKEARKSKNYDGEVPIFVGAVAARGGRLLGKAYRGQKGRGQHAEYTLLEKILASPENVLASATVYSTLEPCTKRGRDKTPCVKWLYDER